MGTTSYDAYLRNKENLTSVISEMKNMLDSAVASNGKKWELFKKQLRHRFGTDEDDLEAI